MGIINEASAGQAASAPQTGAEAGGNAGQASSGTPVANAPAQSGAPSTASWRDTLPDDIKNAPSLSTFTDVAGLAKSYVHAQSKLGVKGFHIPGEKAGEEEWGELYKNLTGDPTKYTVNPPKDYKVDDGFFKEAKESFIKNGLHPRQAQGMLDWYVQKEQKIAQAQADEKKAKVEQDKAGLKREWGEAYDKELSRSLMALKETMGEDGVKYVDQNGLGNDVFFIKFLNKLGKMMGEDTLRGFDGSPLRMTKDELESERQSLQQKLMSLPRGHGDRAKIMAQLENVAKRVWTD